MRSPIILQDVADRAGTSLSTAARALRNSPLVLPATAARIRAIAQELGYVRDPMLAALNAYRHSIRSLRPQGTVAWVTSHATRNGWSELGGKCYCLYRDGAAERLAEHGYGLEEFWLREPGMTARRASQILFNRGIRGLLLCPMEATRGHLSLDWDRFSAVTFGYSMARPKLHMFTAAHYRDMVAVVRKLRTRGFRRIGMVISTYLDERMDHMWSAAVRSLHVILPESRSIPILICDRRRLQSRPGTLAEDRDAFHAWYRRHRPEVVASCSGHPIDWAEELGYRVPGDLGVALVGLQEENRTVSGIVEASRKIGRAAADFLVGMIQRGEYGVPESPQRVLIEGDWFEGRTVAPERTGRHRGRKMLNSR